MKHGQHSADDPLCAQRGRLRAALGLLTTLVHSGDQQGEHLRAALERPGTRAERLDYQQTSHEGLSIEEAEQRDQRGPDPHGPARPWIDDLAHVARCALYSVVERGQETVLAAFEQLVERAPRDTGTRDDMRDRRVRGTALCDQLDDRREDPRSLDLGHLLVTQTVAPRTEPLEPRILAGRLSYESHLSETSIGWGRPGRREG